MRRDWPRDGTGLPSPGVVETVTAEGERRMAELMTTDVRALLDRNPFDASAVADLREVLGP